MLRRLLRRPQTSAESMCTALGRGKHIKKPNKNLEELFKKYLLKHINSLFFHFNTMSTYISDTNTTYSQYKSSLGYM